MPMYQEFTYPSCAAGDIHACRWNPEGRPRAVIQIVHGVAEYAARYDYFASWLAARGFLVVAEDHMGHGGSVCEACPKGDFAGDWFQAVADSHELFCRIRQEYPDLPYILLGHSLGSFMVRTILIRYPDCSLHAAVLSGTGWFGKGTLRAGSMVMGAWGGLFGKHRPSPAMSNLVFGGYNRKVDKPRTDSDWLTREETCVDAYVADPDCGFPLTPALLKAMMSGLRYIQDPEHLSNMNKSLPVYFMSGQEDAVGDFGRGVRRVYDNFREAGMEQVTLQLYPHYRHEVLNETNREGVYEDLLRWLQTQGIVEEMEHA